jgi:hypothetical protein
MEPSIVFFISRQLSFILILSFLEQLPKLPARPAESRMDRRGRYAERRGHAFGAVPIEVVQHERDPEVFAQPAQHLPEVRVIGILGLAISSHRENSPAIRALPQEIATQVPGYRDNPRPESVMVSERAELRECANERFLREILRIGGVSHHGEAHCIDALCMEPYEIGVCLAVPGETRLDDSLISSLFHAGFPFVCCSKRRTIPKTKSLQKTENSCMNRGRRSIGCCCGFNRFGAESRDMQFLFEADGSCCFMVEPFAK